MHRIDRLKGEWLYNLWKPRPKPKSRDHPDFDPSPFLFKEDEAKFKNILRVHGNERADIIALFYPLKLNYLHLVFDHAYTEKDHEAYFQKEFAIPFLTEDYDPEEPRDEYGRWTDGEASFSKKTNAFKAHLGKLPHENGETSFSQLEDHIQHFFEENFETDTTDALDLKQALAENILESTAESFRGSKNPLKIAASLPINLITNAAPAFIKHFVKKGWHFTNKSSLRFPLKKTLPPWMEKEGKWVGKKGSSTSVRIMEPSEDPYQSALNYVRAIRKYQAKNGIASKEILDNSYKKKKMLKIKFDDDAYITIRQAGDSGRQTPNDQVTVHISGDIFLWGRSGRKFKFPETIRTN